MAKRKNILIAALTGLMSFGVVIGIAVPLSSQHSQSVVNTSDSSIGNNFNSEYVNLNNGTIESNSLSFKAENVTLKSKQSISLNSSKQSDSITGFVEKELYTVSGAKKKFLISTLYNSERKYMPILEYDDQGIGNNRLPIDVQKGIYPGWASEVVGVTTSELSKPGFEKSFLKANDTLKTAYKALAEKTITRLVVDTSLLSSDKNTAKKDVETVIKQVQPDFLVLKSDQASFDKLPMNLGSLYSSGKSLKKLQIYGNVTDIKSLQMPSTIEEIEFYAPNLRSIDPLQLPESASLVYDNFISSNFTSIDLSGHKALSTSDLQKAINIVYKTRIKDRYFQNHWAGGYIAHWNLRNTGIYSFNDVTIPKLEDGTGRFYIASVEIETDKGFGSSVNGQIGSGNNPSNDSQIGEWFDWNTNGWSKVTEIVVTSKDNKPVDFTTAIKEVIGFLNKYPNIAKVNISALTFSDTSKTHDDFIAELKQQYNPEKIESITFIKKGSKKI